MKSDSKKTILQTVKESFFVVILTALYLILTLTGCNNIVENPGTGNQNPPESGSNLVAVTGQISLSGAFPGALQSSTGSQRTAIPTVGAVTYTVTAQNKADPGERVTATVTDYNYTLYLSPGTWTISCSGVNESGSQIIREKSPIELTVTQGVATPQPGILELVLSQTPGTGGTGAVSLNGAINFVKDSSATVTVDITLTPWDSSVTAPDIPPQTIKGNGNFTVTLDTVPSGAYMMTLVFSVDGIAVSTVEEAVNVFDNMTTDTWYVGGGNSDHLTPQQDGSAVFNLTRCRTEFFINGNTGDDTNPGSALKPLKTMGKAFSVLGKVKGADAKITLQSDAGDAEDITVPEGVDAVIFGEQAATVPVQISVGDGAAVKVGTNVTCTGGVMVQNGGSLTLTQGGRIDGAGLSGIKNSSGGAVYIEGGAFTMESGSTVTGGNVSANGGAVYVDSGTFTMNGGKISDGNAMLGGNGVFVNIGDFVMNGGEITECGKGSQPGNGAVMIYKSASGDGAGRFVMKSGKIYGNSAEQGAGVFVNGGIFEMSGGTISGNSSSRNGGGVYVDGTFSVSGTPTITNNTVSSNANNVYLPSGKTITIGNDGLTGGTIRVTAEDMKAGGAAQITDTDVPGAADRFVSDISSYSIEETIATTDGGTAVFLSDAEVAYKTSSSAQGNTLGSFAEAYGGKVTEITLLKDITPTTASGFSWPITFKWPCTLDLNGYTINRELSSETDDGQVVVISSNGNLTIKDSSATNSDGTGGIGKITGGYDSGNGQNYGDGGGGIYVEGGSLTLESGSITGNKTFKNGGGVYVGSGCTFTMKGGSITDNTADDYGGGVYVGSSCTFTMTGGFIGSTATPNKACMGGGIYIWNGNVTISGNAQIIGNQTESYPLDSAGAPRYNRGGGVYLSFGTLTMSGNSCISENKVEAGNTYSTGGGVYVDGSFTVSGTPTITGNTVSGSANNVYLPDGKIITIGAGGLTSGDIGVTAENMATGIAVQITDKNVAGADGIFTSDNTLYHVEEFATGISGTAVFLSD